MYRHDRPDSAYVALAAPYQGLVHLNLGKPGGPADGEGTLIAPRWVLTAAHVAGELRSGHRVSIGSKLYSVDTVLAHPNWRDGGPNDLALVRLAAPVLDAQPVPLWRGRDELGRRITIVGYGDFGTGLSGPIANDGRIRAATNCIDRATDPWLIFTFDPPDSPNTTPFEGVSGPGDSGGPAFLEFDATIYLAGISSGQSSRATGGKPGRYGVVEYYTRVSSYVRWITGIIGPDDG